MTKRFTKGQKATYFTRWNSAGDFAYRDVIVYSCGNKRMVLTCERTGEELGRRYNPTGIDSHEIGTGFVLAGTVERMTDAEAEAFCNEKAAEYKKKELDRIAAAEAAGTYPNNDYWNDKLAKEKAALRAAPVAHKR